MLKLSALFIVFFISTYTFTSMETGSIDGFSTLGGVHSELIAMKTEVKVAQNDGVKTVAQFTDRLVRMLKDLQETQRKHEGIASRMFAQCKEEASFRIRQIQQGQQSYNAASNAFAKCQASLKAAIENLPTLKNARKEYVSLLARKTAERKRQFQLYSERANDWKSAIMFLNDFTIAVNKAGMKRGFSFADLSETLLKHASKLGFVAEVVPLLAQLAQSPSELASSVPSVKHKYTYLNQAATINSLLHHLNNLKNRLIVDSRQNDLNEQKAQKIFDQLKVRLTGIINKLETDIRRTNKQIRDMQNCVSTEGSIMKTSSNKVIRNKRLKVSAANTCADFAREFVEATRNRNEEIRTIQEVMNLCAKRFGELPHDLVSYLSQVRNQFKNYVNSTSFQKYVAYVEKHISDNQYGRALAAGKRYVTRKLEAKVAAKKNLHKLTRSISRKVAPGGLSPSRKAIKKAKRRAARAAARKARKAAASKASRRTVKRSSRRSSRRAAVRAARRISSGYSGRKVKYSSSVKRRASRKASRKAARRAARKAARKAAKRAAKRAARKAAKRAAKRAARKAARRAARRAAKKSGKRKGKKY